MNAFAKRDFLLIAYHITKSKKYFIKLWISSESFDFTQGNGSFIDNTKIEQGVEILRERIKP
jgi:hypothetical protein